MKSSRAYLIRALHEWIVDNHCTPYLIIDAEFPEAVVPQEHINDGQIILNISLSAVKNLSLGNDAVQFNARFSGVSHHVYVPIDAVMAIYARENGQGMMFGSENETISSPDPSPDGTPPPAPSAPKSRPKLTVVK